MRRFSILFIILLTLISCNSKKNDKELPVITVSIVPQLYFTEALAHDFFRVESMVPRGSSPETYDPTPRQMVALENSALYLRIGYIGFELGWINKLTSNAPHLEFFETSQGINLLMEKGAPRTNNQHLSPIEPHVWCSTQNAKIIAQNTYRILTSFDRKNEKEYTMRLEKLIKHIDETDSIIRVKLSTTGADKAFAIYHPSLSYFARDYGLAQIAIENNGKEPSPSQLASIIAKCKAKKVHIIFVQPEFDKRNAEIIAQQIGARVVSINPLNKEWDKEMIAIADALSQTIKK